MEAELTGEKNREIILEDNSLYLYSIQPVEITNVLGAVIAVLEEYSITGSKGENYKIYKTKEGNWYDIADITPAVNNPVLRALKLAIDNK